MRAPVEPVVPLFDSYQRRINYLRLSITDRCNFRCLYCMPSEGVEKYSHGEILTFEELLMISKAALSLGISKIRITGGEPLVRKGLLPFLHQLRQLPGLQQLVLTTNGYNLQELAQPLLDAGVERMNISIDSLQADRFEKITRLGTLQRVWDGIVRADALGFPIKLNVVVMRGVNDDEILDFAALTLKHNWSVRFIEYMPTALGSHQRWWLSTDEIYRRINQLYPLEQTSEETLSGPATTYRIRGAKGEIGIISAISCSFCSSCNRVRVTSTGGMRNCLFAEDETDLKPYLQAKDMDALKLAMQTSVHNKPLSHHLMPMDAQTPALRMSQVGG